MAGLRGDGLKLLKALGRVKEVKASAKKGKDLTTPLSPHNFRRTVFESTMSTTTLIYIDPSVYPGDPEVGPYKGGGKPGCPHQTSSNPHSGVCL